MRTDGAEISRVVEPETAEEGRWGRGTTVAETETPDLKVRRSICLPRASTADLKVRGYVYLDYRPSRNGFSRRDRDG